jgi:hypothetical protein
MAEGGIVGSLWIKLGVDPSGLTDGIANAAASFDVITMAAQIAMGAAQQGFDDTVGAAISYADDMQHVSDVTGMSTESAQKWNAANIAVGGSLDSMLSSLQMVQGKIADTTTAGKTYRKELDDLGIAYKDQNGNYLDADTLQKNILESLSKVTDATQRDSDARLIYGRGWASNAELITNATKALQVYNATPSPFSDDQIAAAHNMGIELDQFNEKISITQTEIGMELLPSVNTLANLFESAFNQDSPIITFFSWLDGAIEDTVEGFAKLVGGIEAGTEAINDLATGKGLSQSMADFQGQENKTNAYITNLQGQFDLTQGTMAKPSQSSPVIESSSPDTSGDSGGSSGTKSGKTSTAKTSSTTAKAGSGWDGAAIGDPGTAMYQYMMDAYADGMSYSEALNAWSGNARPTASTLKLAQQFQQGQANQGMNATVASLVSSTGMSEADAMQAWQQGDVLHGDAAATSDPSKTAAASTTLAKATSTDPVLTAIQKWYSDWTPLNQLEQSSWKTTTGTYQTTVLSNWATLLGNMTTALSTLSTIAAKTGTTPAGSSANAGSNTLATAGQSTSIGGLY